MRCPTAPTCHGKTMGFSHGKTRPIPWLIIIVLYFPIQNDVIDVIIGISHGLDKLGFGKLEVWSEEHMLSREGEHFNNSFGIEHRLRLKKTTSTWSLLGFHVRFPPAANAANVGAYVFL